MDYKEYNYSNDNLIKSEDHVLEGFMSRVYAWMAVALSISGITAYAAASGSVAHRIATTPGLFWGIAIATFVCVIAISFLLLKLPLPLLIVIYIGYSFLTGLTLSIVFLIYTSGSIVSTFFITAGAFSALSVYGFVTKRDLSAMGSFMFIGLVGLILASIVNIYMKSPAVYWALTVIGIVVFAGLTAYDTQKLRDMGKNIEGESSDVQLRMAISGALRLYLDFINLFLKLLRLFGRRR